MEMSLSLSITGPVASKYGYFVCGPIDPHLILGGGGKNSTLDNCVNFYTAYTNHDHDVASKRILLPRCIR